MWSNSIVATNISSSHRM